MSKREVQSKINQNAKNATFPNYDPGIILRSDLIRKFDTKTFYNNFLQRLFMRWFKNPYLLEEVLETRYYKVQIIKGVLIPSTLSGEVTSVVIKVKWLWFAKSYCCLLDIDLLQIAGINIKTGRRLTLREAMKRCIARYETLLPRNLESKNFQNSLLIDPDHALNECDNTFNRENCTYSSFFHHRGTHR
ncbi:CFC_HP_G0059890.mRNA.1.CDS.1 [Saccharomyces cerevisiae]|nr:CFC_HP_G0059890.mRNA.1.CDS.1 [Saccharomyces cerevisiae]CAI6567871.1 CFC_HP_G0059890.mRNA.1.CDS.1 [Saccharomyces cerevisiae]